MSERFFHPAFGYLTDEEDIRIAKRQQAEAEYYKAMEKAYEEEYRKVCEQEAADYDEYARDMDCNPRYEGKPISFEKWLEIKYPKKK